MQKLPKFMIPQEFIQVESMPITKNGKIDRKLLLENYIGGEMLSIKKITQLAKENSTPLYIFDKDELADRISSIKSIVGDGVTICYAMKAKPFLLDGQKSLM